MNAKSSSKPAPLGRGLSALFGDADNSYRPRPVPSSSAPTVINEKNEIGAKTIAIDLIQPGAYQARVQFNEEAIEELAASIRERGVLQPLMVRSIPGGKYELIAGERRWRAAQRAGLHDVPVLVRSFTDREAMEIGLIENVQRQDLTALEEAEGYKRLMDEFSYKQDDISRVVGKSRTHVGNMMRLMKLPSLVQKMISEGDLSMGHARAIITALDPEGLAKEIVKKGLSVRQAESLARRAAKDGTTSRTVKHERHDDPDILAIEKDVGGKLGLKVSLRPKAHGGTLTFYYGDLDQLDMLLKKVGA